MYTQPRAAPSPPNSIPSGHPFASYYVPEISKTISIYSRSSAPPSPSASTTSRSTYSTQSRPFSAPTTPDSFTKNRPDSFDRDLGSRPAYSALPVELSVLDHRPRQTLLTDLETIFGKKLHFPLLSRRTAPPPQETENARKREVKERQVSGDLGPSRMSRKQREHSWEEDFAWDGVRAKDGKAGPGMREGNRSD